MAFSLSVHLFSWIYLSSLIPFIPLYRQICPNSKSFLWNCESQSGSARYIQVGCHTAPPRMSVWSGSGSTQPSLQLLQVTSQVEWGPGPVLHSGFSAWIKLIHVIVAWTTDNGQCMWPLQWTRSFFWKITRFCGDPAKKLRHFYFLWRNKARNGVDIQTLQLCWQDIRCTISDRPVVGEGLLSFPIVKLPQDIGNSLKWFPRSFPILCGRQKSEVESSVNSPIWSESAQQNQSENSWKNSPQVHSACPLLQRLVIQSEFSSRLFFFPNSKRQFVCFAFPWFHSSEWPSLPLLSICCCFQLVTDCCNSLGLKRPCESFDVKWAEDSRMPN